MALFLAGVAEKANHRERPTCRHRSPVNRSRSREKVSPAEKTPALTQSEMFLDRRPLQKSALELPPARRIGLVVRLFQAVAERRPLHSAVDPADMPGVGRAKFDLQLVGDLPRQFGR